MLGRFGLRFDFIGRVCTFLISPAIKRHRRCWQPLVMSHFISGSYKFASGFVQRQLWQVSEARHRSPRRRNLLFGFNKVFFTHRTPANCKHYQPRLLVPLILWLQFWEVGKHRCNRYQDTLLGRPPLAHPGSGITSSSCHVFLSFCRTYIWKNTSNGLDRNQYLVFQFKVNVWKVNKWFYFLTWYSALCMIHSNELKAGVERRQVSS